MSVDVSRIPNNSKFDPVREAILDLEQEISSGVAGVSSVNNQTGAVTIAQGSNVSITTNNGVITISSTASGGGTLEGELTLAAGDGIGLSSPSVFDGSTDLTVTITNTDRPNDGQLNIITGAGISTATGETWTQKNINWSIDTATWASSAGASFSANAFDDANITIEHGNTSDVQDVVNVGGNVLQSMSFDQFGHVQSTSSVNLDNRYLQSANANVSNWDAAYNDKINSASFNTSTGVITLNQQDGGTVTVDIDGKYLNIGDKAADANLLDGLDSTYFLNYNNLTNKPTIPTVNNNTITVAAGGAMTGGGDFTVNQGVNETITISHADTSTQGSVNNSGNTFIQDITLDTYGHITGLTSASVSIPNVFNPVITINSGAGLTGSGSFGLNQSSADTITISHADTSAQGSVNNSGGTVIQDIFLDTYGHITSIGSANLDGRYLLLGGKAADANLLDGLDSTYFLNYNNLNNKPTATVANNNTITISATSGLTGGGSFTVNQSFNETISISHANTSNLSGTYGSTLDTVKIDTITVDANGHVTAITTGAVSGGGSTPTLDQVTDAGNVTTNSVSIFKGTAPSFALDVGGTIRATGDVIAFSDERVKENIVTIDSALEKLLQLRGVEYNKIGSEEQSIGVIAQEVEKILPEVVREDEQGMKSVAYGNMVGLLIEAVKEQQKQIDELKAIINGSTK